jgi:hypothetical protein
MGRIAQPSTDDPVAGLNGIHTILPVQFFVESAKVRTGEQRLMAAVLEDAIALHFKSTPRDTAKRSTLQQEQAQADHWLRSNDRASVFSFLRICEALSLDPQYLRRGLRTLQQWAVIRRTSSSDVDADPRPHAGRGSRGWALKDRPAHHSGWRDPR